MSRRLDTDEVVKTIGTFNRISIADFEIESTTASLDDVVKIMKEMIKNYSGFVAERSKAIVSKNSGGYCG